MQEELFSHTHPHTHQSADELRIAQLRTDLERHNRLYYVDAAPEISDREYDALMAELVTLEKKHPALVTPDSPSQRVGGEPLTSFKTFEHLIPMQSLDNTYSIGEVAEFDKSVHDILGAQTVDYVVEPKIDGLAFALHYKHGVLSVAATRGNGTVGDDVTANAKTIHSIPLRLPTEAAHLEVRGEIFMPKDGFLRLTNEQVERGEEPFKNPRNAAAGSMKLLNPALVAKRPLDCVIYALGAVDGIEDPGTHAALTQMLAHLDFRTQPKTWLCHGLDDVLAAIAALEKMRHDFAFEMDGAVIKVNDRAMYKTLGATAKAPRWARAYKYAPEQAQTVVEAITVQVGRTGVLTPVAELRTVRLAGSDISRATLHNEDEIRRKDVRIGDHVMIEKAGEVIPAIVAVVTAARTGSEIEFHMPSACPVCGEPVSREEDEVAVRCRNFLCPAQLSARLTHFASRDALDISGLGERVAKALVDQNCVKDPLDLFDQSEEWLATLLLAGDTAVVAESGGSLLESDVEKVSTRVLGKSNAHTIMTALERSRTLPLARWLYALGIPNIGVTVARDIAALHDDFNDLVHSRILSDTARLYALMDEADACKPSAVRDKDIETRVACAEKFTHITDEIETLGNRLVAEKLAEKQKGATAKYRGTVKPESCRALVNFFDSASGKSLVERMRQLGINPVGKSAKTAAVVNDTLAGKSFVFTGTLTGMTRSKAAELVRAHGGTVRDSVTKEIAYLVIGDDPGGTKYDKAHKLDIPIISEPEFMQMLGDAPSAVSQSDTPPEQLSFL